MHIAIVGCGQLSRMLALAGIPLGHRFSFIASDVGEDVRCVEHLGQVCYQHEGQSAAQLYQQLGKPDVVTTEKEQINCADLYALQAHCPVHPNPASFATLQDRLLEKQLLDELGIPSSPYCFARTAAQAAQTLSLPLVVKSRRDGYDGKNQQILRDEAAITAFDAAEGKDRNIIERWIPFDREVSQISVRDLVGNVRHYPLTENVHQQGILRRSMAPAQHIPSSLRDTARSYITAILEALDYVGVIAMECFVCGDQLLVNEVAPRVHNSGHWTQSGSVTSQFENHLRAISGVPLGATNVQGVTGMVNLIGTSAPPAQAFSQQSTLHWYNKVARPGRKLGHVNFTGSNHTELRHQMDNFSQQLSNSGADQ